MTSERDKDKQAREAAKKAKIEAERLAKEQAKQKAEEERKAADAAKLAKIEAERLAKEQAQQKTKSREMLGTGGQSYLVVLSPPVSPPQVDSFIENLSRIPELKINMIGGSQNGTLVSVFVEKPINLTGTLSQIPEVESVSTKAKDIIVSFRLSNPPATS